MSRLNHSLTTQAPKRSGQGGLRRFLIAALAVGASAALLSPSEASATPASQIQQISLENGKIKDRHNAALKAIVVRELESQEAEQIIAAQEVEVSLGLQEGEIQVCELEPEEAQQIIAEIQAEIEAEILAEMEGVEVKELGDRSPEEVELRELGPEEAQRIIAEIQAELEAELLVEAEQVEVRELELLEAETIVAEANQEAALEIALVESDAEVEVRVLDPQEAEELLSLGDWGALLEVEGVELDEEVEIKELEPEEAEQIIAALNYEAALLSEARAQRKSQKNAALIKAARAAFQILKEAGLEYVGLR